MGTDMHGHVEVRTEVGWLPPHPTGVERWDNPKQRDELFGYLPRTTVDGAWLPQPGQVKRWLRYEYSENYRPQVQTDGAVVTFDHAFDRGRDYALFAALARVRLWAGDERGTLDVLGFPQAKGFPEDAHEITRMHFDRWGADAHTPTHLTIAEMRQIVAALGATPLHELALAEAPEELKRYREWAQAGEQSLRPWCEDIWAAVWATTAYARSQGFELTPNDVRVVVWFDN